VCGIPIPGEGAGFVTCSIECESRRDVRLNGEPLNLMVELDLVRVRLEKLLAMAHRPGAAASELRDEIEECMWTNAKCLNAALAMVRRAK
jgi:hypothetical protein